MNNEQILQQAKRIAVIGVTQNKEKYGYKIYIKLKELKKIIFGISPIYKEIEGEKTYESLNDVHEPIDLAVFVVNPKLGSGYVEACKKANIKRVWMQPNTLDDSLYERFKKEKIKVIQGCVLISGDKLIHEENIGD